MPRGRAKEPGIKALPNVPYRSDEAAPNSYDADTRRGALRNVPRGPIYRCLDFGGPANPETGGISSPASATFTRGRPEFTNERRDKRVLPENQLPGSLATHAGLGMPVKGAGGPPLKD